MQLTKIDYSSLNSRQKEIYNFQTVASLLNKYGFNCIKLADDWNGADFIANHLTEDIFLKVQLKARISINKKYLNKNIYMCFPNKTKTTWYLVPHDTLIEELQKQNTWINAPSWTEKGWWSSASIPQKLEGFLSNYKL